MNKTKKWYEELYQDFAAYSEEPYVQNTEAEVDFIERVITYDRAKSILDIGCGNGRHSLALARRGYQVLGTDLSESMLAQGRQVAAAENIAVQFMACDARQIYFEGEFDVTIMLCEGAFSLMEHDEMDRLILSNIARALKPAGKLIMTAPNAAYMIAQQSGDAFDLTTLRERFNLDRPKSNGKQKILECSQRYYTCPELKWLLRQAGFWQVEFFACTDEGYKRGQKPVQSQFEFGIIAVK